MGKKMKEIDRRGLIIKEIYPLLTQVIYQRNGPAFYPLMQLLFRFYGQASSKLLLCISDSAQSLDNFSTISNSNKNLKRRLIGNPHARLAFLFQPILKKPYVFDSQWS